MASLLDGVFAFILLDTTKRKVFLGRDIYGVRPLFKMITEDGFLSVCSEAKGKIQTVILLHFRPYFASQLHSLNVLLTAICYSNVIQTGLTEIKHSMSTPAKITPFPPGHFEEFNLKSTGKVEHVQMNCFQNFTDEPKHTTYDIMEGLGTGRRVM